MPYRGTAPALNDLVGGQIDIIVDQASNSMQQIRAGRIRAYAITDTKRLKAAPEIPTAEEAGLPGFHMTLWNGLWVPKGTPKDIVARLNAAAVEAMADPAVAKRLNDLGLEVPPRDQQTPQALGHVAQGRGREMVADHQEGRHQAGIAVAFVKMRRRSTSVAMTMKFAMLNATPAAKAGA